MSYILNKNISVIYRKYLPLQRRQNFFVNTSLRFFSIKSETVTEKKEISSTLLKAKYNPNDTESGKYEWWESKNYFKPNKSESESFVLLLPPPNVTGILHLGHALTATIQDVIVRWKRMKGESVLWIPGMDHAGIATQVMVEKHLKQYSGLSKYDLGKDEFIKKVWEWKDEKGKKIVEQFKNLGASLDWSKLKFTLDPIHSEIVASSFIKLYNEGLIYRTRAPVNWSCALKSSISDVEVEWLDINGRTKLTVPGYEKPVDFGTMYEFSYKICGEDDEIVVSTTRPETMLGDVAVAIHPEDPDYSKYKDKKVWHPFRKVEIPIIPDEMVELHKGTKAVKITPSHSTIDFEVGLKHNLPSIDVIDEDGRIKEIGCNEKFFGLKRFEARNLIINELKNLGLFKSYKNHSMKVPICSRSGDVIEIILKDQWFLKCKTLAENVVKAIENGSLQFKPESSKNVLFTWLNNIKDWNLSRQLWWGHQIPMYKCQKGIEVIWIPAMSMEEARTKASTQFGIQGHDVTISRDPDVLDTWFSSGLLPLNTLSEDGLSKRDSPISLMITGHDILFFWVARMVMLGVQLTGRLPFKDVFLHGLIYDSKGRKMSKSLGNVLHPEDIINGCSLDDINSQLQNSTLSKKELKEALDYQKKKFPNGIPECGVDALRLTLCSTDILCQNINFDMELCLSSRHFCNKIWQAMNYFIKIVCDGESLNLVDLKTEKNNLNCFDKWIISRLSNTVEIVDGSIADYKFYLAAQAIKLFVVEDFCSVYLESSKPILKECSPLAYNTTVSVFFYCMETSLRLLSPFMPFLSEHLYQALPDLSGFERSESVTVTQFPSSYFWNDFRDLDLDDKFKKILQIVSALRSAKAEYSCQKKPKVFIKCSDDVSTFLTGDMSFAFNKLAGVESITRVTDFDKPNVIEKSIDENCTAYIEHEHDKKSLGELLKSKLSKEENIKKSLSKLQKLSSETNWEEQDPVKKATHLKSICNLKMELQKIEEYKKTINNCCR